MMKVMNKCKPNTASTLNNKKNNKIKYKIKQIFLLLIIIIKLFFYIDNSHMANRCTVQDL